MTENKERKEWVMNKNNTDMPWNLTISYGRALQADALVGWEASGFEGGQSNLLKRAKSNGLASCGEL